MCVTVYCYMYTLDRPSAKYCDGAWSRGGFQNIIKSFNRTRIDFRFRERYLKKKLAKIERKKELCPEKQK